MKDHDLQSLVDNHLGAIKASCERHGAPFGRVNASGALSAKQRNTGLVGRLCVVLADVAPGWRSKDNPDGRQALKRDIRDLLAAAGIPVAVHVQAAFSVLVADGDMIRRVDHGRVVGVYGT